MARKPSRTTSPEEARRIADKYFTTPEAEAPQRGSDPTPAREKTLTPKEGLFVQEYLVDMNATQAAIRAGYSEKSAAAIGYENLRKPHIRRAILEAMKEREARTQWTADRLLQRLGEELTADIADIYDEKGGLKPIQEWPLIFRQGLVAGIEIEQKDSDDPDALTGDTTIRTSVVKIKMSDRLKRLELLGKHVGIQAFKEKVEHDVSDPVKKLYEQIAGNGIGPGDAQSTTSAIAAPEGAAELEVKPKAGPRSIRPKEDGDE